MELATVRSSLWAAAPASTSAVSLVLRHWRRGALGGRQWGRGLLPTERRQRSPSAIRLGPIIRIDSLRGARGL